MSDTLVRGQKYRHPSLGVVIAIATDPEDGALWIVRRVEPEDDNIMDYRGTEADHLTPIGAES